MGRHPADAAGRLAGAVLVATAARTVGRDLPAVLAERVLGDLSPAWTRTGRIGTSLARRSLGAGAHPAHAVAVRDLLHATPGSVRVACLLAMARMDLVGLAGAEIPATVLVGSRDLLTPPRSARALTSAWPGAEMTMLPGAGHMLPIERPDDVVEAILARIPPARRPPRDGGRQRHALAGVGHAVSGVGDLADHEVLARVGALDGEQCDEPGISACMPPMAENGGGPWAPPSK
ncbi:hypothetical protein GH723_02325 [Actinomarinicola tropica]|uniref:AB hydrolase-1 domain-containing protein n=1 Tax=Actinomarinicola tropica TaxID=2789776 RepID=A0A5Q2REG4_9ACTN|nr:hypothetical protein GH723_02325 [Actinomarinicola tropica]